MEGIKKIITSTIIFLPIEIPKGKKEIVLAEKFLEILESLLPANMLFVRFFCTLACAGWLLTFSLPLWGSWKTLHRCTLVEHPGNDGDSFHVRHQGKEYIFRLYYVDSPETSSMFPERIKDQAAYFGITPSRITSLGKEASDFSRAFLADTFTVRTMWKDAG